MPARPMEGVAVRIRFDSEGFRRILVSAPVDALAASYARKRAQAMESQTGEPYEVEQRSKATRRASYLVKPAGAEIEKAKIDHETWMNEIWPKVGGPKWRPHR